MIHTTFRQLKEAGACSERYRYLARKLGGVKKHGKDTPITLKQILDINGLDDALWALRACNDSERFSRLLACDCAGRVLPIYEAQYPEDDRPRKAIEIARRYANGEVTLDELSAARDAVIDASRAVAVDAVWYAAWAAAWAASGDSKVVAMHASQNATWAAWAATQAIRVAAYVAERKWQEQRLREILEEVE